MPGEHTEILGYKEFEKIKILVAFLSGLIALATFVVWLFSNIFVTLPFLTSSFAAILIGVISVSAVVIMNSPKHSSNSALPAYLIQFQERIKVSD